MRILRNWMAELTEEYLKRYRAGENVDLLDKWLDGQLHKEVYGSIDRDRFEYQLTTMAIAAAQTAFTEYKIRLDRGQSKATLAEFVKAEAEQWPNKDDFLTSMRGHVKGLLARRAKLDDPKSVRNQELAKMKSMTRRKR